MNRNHRDRKRQYQRDDNPYEGRSKKPEKRYDSSPLNEVGLSVFRRFETGELDETTRLFKQYSNNLIRIDRNTADQYGMAVNLVSLQEVRAVSFIGGVTVHEVIDDIYSSVPSLRKPLNIKTGGVAFLGRPQHKIRPLGVVVHEDDRAMLRDERSDIISVLNGYTAENLSREDWTPNHLPHISIGKILMSGLQPAQRRVMFNKMNHSLPDFVHVDRATLHNPAK